MARFKKDGTKVINSRAKGADFERKIAKLLTSRGFKARRGNQFNGMWDADVETEYFPYHVEAKKVQVLNIFKAYAQSERDSKATSNKTPIVIHAKNNTKIMVTVELHDFLNLVQWAMGKTDSMNSLELDAFRELYLSVENDEDLL